MKLARSLQSFRRQTFTILSQPPEMISGAWVFGEKRTHETQSLWPSRPSIVYFISPTVFQRRIVLSREPDTIWRLSNENATDSTSLVCPRNSLVVLAALRSQRRSVLSQLAESANMPSDDTTTSSTKS